MKPIIFLVPVIALLLVAILYWYLAKDATINKKFRKFILAAGVVGFVLNLAWELIQMPLYNNGSFSINHVAFCALGAVADAIMVLLLYLVVALFLRKALWIHQLTFLRAITVVLTGGTLAIVSEMRHLSIGSWAYSKSMPIIYGVNVGISPVLQFMILPLLTYVISSKLNKASNKE